MKTNDLRESFIAYFKKNSHEFVTSSSLLPENDPTLLFTNAGMNQFKNVFTGIEKRAYKRAVSSQKCIRAGGKHNDLDNVGFTARHHTFFEMLGNFSFGDYFKKEAIHFAWELITKEWQIPKDRLYVTVFEKDDEAADLWHKQEGIPRERIFRFGEKDNFWRMGNSGPCGPCSEIFFDLGDKVGGDPAKNVMGGEGDRFMEIWNLVFMQFNESEDGQQVRLPNPSIDTGAGLERLAAVLQGELSNYHTDTFRNIIDGIGKKSGRNYVYDTKALKGASLAQTEEQNVAFRVLADHARSVAFLLSEGVLPSNEGRGYVLRRIMRRAIRYGRTLSEDKSLFPVAVGKVIEGMGPFYRDLQQREKHILTSTEDEEKRFLHTLDQGTLILRDELKKMESRGQKVLRGDVAFKLYDTFGFPLDLTSLMAAESGFSIDNVEFQKQLEQAKEKAKSSWKSKGLSANTSHLIKISNEAKTQTSATEFTGYKSIEGQSVVSMISNGDSVVNELKAGQTGFLIFSQTPFYAEGGGQVGDSGEIESVHGHAEVLDTVKYKDVFLHQVNVTSGSIKLKDKCVLRVAGQQRRNTRNNHSATHLMHAALRKVLGDHVTQAGSLVEPQRLRFDFTHKQPMSPDEIQQVEDLVNGQIQSSREVGSDVMAHQAALNFGALALFGEKYGDEVRVISMGDFSKELCGGTHVNNTSEILVLKIVSESGVSSGVRRIEAITGENALRYLLKSQRELQQARNAIGAQDSWQTFLEQNQNPLEKWIETQKSESKQLQREVQNLKGGQIDLESYLGSAKSFSFDGQESKLVLVDIAIEDRKLLSDVTDKLKDRVSSGIIVVVGKGEDSHPILVSVTKNLVGTFKAGDILGQIAATMKGKGGGRPDFAQGAGKDRNQLSLAFTQIQEKIR